MGDHDGQKSTKSDTTITGSPACFDNNGQIYNNLNPANIINTTLHRSITARLHSIALLSHGSALINENMDQTYLFLDSDYNKTPSNHSFTVSPSLKIATLFRPPLFYDIFSQKITPDIGNAYSRRGYRSDIQHLCRIFQCIYRLVVLINVSSSTRNTFVFDKMIYYPNLPINENVLQFPYLWRLLRTLDLSKDIKHIPVLEDDLDIQQVAMRPSVFHELFFALLATLVWTMTPPVPQEHDNSIGAFSIFSSPYSIISTFLDGFSTESGDGVSSSSGNKVMCHGNLFRLSCGHLFEALAIFCSVSQRTWHGFGGGRSFRIERWSLPSFLQLVLGVVDPWVQECKKRTLSFFTVSDVPLESVCALKNKLRGGGCDYTDLSKILRLTTSIPYIMERQAETDRKEWVYSTQNKWSQTRGDIILKALNSFDGDSEIGDIVVDTLLELLKTGQGKWKQDKSLAKNVLCLIKNFARNMMSVQSNGDFQQQILQFTPSVQQPNRTSPANQSVNDKAIQTSTSLEENDDLRRTVDQLRKHLHDSEEMIIKLQWEKNDLEMKMKACDNKFLATQQLAHQKAPSALHQQHQQPAVGDVVSAIDSELCLSSPIPTPPPPPPMPTFDNSCKGRNIRPRSTSKSSTYFHPLALNLNFASLKSLHENTPSSPTSPTANDDASIPEATGHQRIAVDQTNLRQAPKITMKQFFWSKLPWERIQNTVWKEISTGEVSTGEVSMTVYNNSNNNNNNNNNNSSSSSSSSSNNNNNNNRQATRQQWRKQPYHQYHDNKLVDLDIVVLEKLFKKTQGTKEQTASQHQGLQTMTKLQRKQPLTTLLDFNRANNIAIMLARIKLTYPEICDSILKIDDRLNVDNLMAIRQYIPTKEEIETIQDYNGDGDTLGNSEKYFKAIMGIPRLADRIDCIIFQRKFNHEIQELLPELDILQLAIDELRHSHQFKLILKTILAIGNYLNDRTIRGNAYGFHLDALLKMGDTKAEDKGDINLPTLLHYLVFFLSKTGKQKVATFKDDTPHLESAAQISTPTLFASVKSLDGNLDHIQKELALHQQMPTSQKMDRFTELMKAFLEEAGPVVENVKSLARDIQERLKDLIMYYGEDPTLVKPQDFFSVICTFSSSFEKAKMEIEQARQKALRQQQNTNKKLSKDALASTPSFSLAKTTPKLYGNLARTSLRAVSTTDTQDGSSKNEGFGQVLQELRAGLKRGDHSWRVEASTRRTSVGHCDGPTTVLF